jgi:hypothetical protein
LLQGIDFNDLSLFKLLNFPLELFYPSSKLLRFFEMNCLESRYLLFIVLLLVSEFLLMLHESLLALKFKVVNDLMIVLAKALYKDLVL